MERESWSIFVAQRYRKCGGDRACELLGLLKNPSNFFLSKFGCKNIISIFATASTEKLFIDIAKGFELKNFLNFFSQNFETLKNFLTFATASTEKPCKQKELKNNSKKISKNILELEKSFLPLQPLLGATVIKSDDRTNKTADNYLVISSLAIRKSYLKLQQQ